MMRALSSGISGLHAHQTAMDVIGNNIANVDTYGFKSSNVMFRDSLYEEMAAASAPNATSGTGGMDPSEIGYGVNASSVSVNMGSGSFSATGKATDCEIDGEGYFVIANGTPAGDKKVAPASYKYTRVGSLHFDKSGYLVDGNKCRVCGQTNGVAAKTALTTANTAATSLLPADYTTTGNVPQYINYDPDPTYNDLKDVAVSVDGTVTATNDGQPVIVGKIALAHFQNPNGLSQIGDSYYINTENSGDAGYAAPGDTKTGTGKLKPGGLESSNVDLATEFANMITYERGFQANSKIMNVADEMLETLVNMKR